MAEDLASLDHATLLRMRREARDQARQNQLAPYEHRAFARELTEENPLYAASLLYATPLYQLAKMIGLTGARSDPSLEQMAEGYRGIGEGLKRRLMRRDVPLTTADLRQKLAKGGSVAPRVPALAQQAAEAVKAVNGVMPTIDKALDGIDWTPPDDDYDAEVDRAYMNAVKALKV